MQKFLSATTAVQATLDFQSIAIDALMWSLVWVGPFVAFTLMVHWLERFVFVRLAERFGWRVMLWTGWLGTPVHELSHILACKCFGHKIVDWALFEPDLKAKRLGYVAHTYKKGNWYQELGNFFIGVAPLVGGSMTLGILLWLFYPDAAAAAVEVSKSEGQQGGLARAMLAVLGTLFTGENLLTLRFWTFLYMVLCVGGHMAPSRSDYEGAGRGGLMVGAFVIVAALVPALFQVDLVSGVSAVSKLLTPLLALLLLTLVLTGVAAMVVYVLTSFFPKRFTLSRN